MPRSPLASFLLTAVLCLPTFAVPHETRLPLHDGKIKFSDLSNKLLAELHCPSKLRVPIPGDIDLKGYRNIGKFE